MIRKEYNSNRSNRLIITSFKTMKKDNRRSLISNLIILAVAIISILASVFFNLNMLGLSQQSAESANKSAGIANDALNETKKLVNWTEPKPNLQIWSDKDFWGKNGTAYVIISPDYSPYTGAKGFISPPGFSYGPITIDFLVFNSGKAPVAAALCYVALECNETNDIFPFKIYNISTPLQSVFYDEASAMMKQSYMTNFPAGHKAVIPYWQWNEKSVLDFPPSFLHGQVVFRNLILPYQYHVTRINYSSSQYIWDYKVGSIGPFSIGNIEPGETKHVYVSVFGAVSDYWNMSAEYWTERKPFAEGNFTINVESANCKMVTYSFPIKSFFNPP